MRCAIYIRVSTEEQVKEGYSIGAQKERLDAYVKSQGWEIISYYVDEGISAKDTNRPELQRMIKTIEDGIIDVVLVYRLDRLTRSVLDLYQLLETFDKNGCHFKSATEVYDTTTAIGRLFITLVAALAQWERENLGERVRMGMTQKVREGEWHGSTPPIGYLNVDGNLIINEEEAVIVRNIFKWYADEGLSDNKIAIKLNEMGIETKKGMGIWRENRVRYILRNPTYCGHLHWNVRVNKDQYFLVKDAVPKIIDEETFENAQSVRKARSSVHPRVATSKHIFSGSLRCARCGASMKGHKKKDSKGREYRSYRCINRYAKKCDMPLIAETILEKAFMHYFENIELKPKSDKSSTSIKKKQLNEEDHLNIELDKIKKRRKKWQYAWANDLLTDQEYKERISEENSKEQLILDELNKLNVSNFELDDKQVEVISVYINDNWNEMNVHEKKVFIQNTVSKMVLEKKESQVPSERVKILELSFK